MGGEKPGTLADDLSQLKTGIGGELSAESAHFSLSTVKETSGD